MNKQRLLEIIKNSGLPEEDKKEWESIIESSPQEVTETLFGVFSQFPEGIDWLNDVYKRKKGAFSEIRRDKVKGENIFLEIIKEEKEKLNILSS